MTAAIGNDPSALPDQAEAPTARLEALRADLALIDEHVFGGTGGGSLDEELAALRQIALHILGGDCA
jgi:hypothetical protein